MTNELEALNLLSSIRDRGNGLFWDPQHDQLMPIPGDNVVAADMQAIARLRAELIDILATPDRGEVAPPTDPDVRRWYEQQSPFMQESFQMYCRMAAKGFHLPLTECHRRTWRIWQEQQEG